MKWVFLAFLVLLIPLLSGALRSNPRYTPACCFALGAGIFSVAPHAWAAPIAWPGWQGPVHGIEVSLVDAISVALIMSTKQVSIPRLTQLALALFSLGLFISLLAANQRMPAIFYMWQFFRAVLLFIAIARVSARSESAPLALLGGLGLGLVYEAVLAVYQFKTGADRPGGNLGHANSLGLAADFVLFPTFALSLGTRRLLWPAIVLVSGLVIALVGGSRATIGLFAVGCILTLILSLIHVNSSRKIAFGGAVLVILLLGAPVFVWAANQRPPQVLQSSDVERAAMKDAAAMIMFDHPFGIGANQYVVVANTGGYSQRAGVPWNFSERSAPVHDTYYLLGAETGFIGLLGFVAIILSFVVVGWRALRLPASYPRHALLPGLLATMIIASIHISYEWVFMEFTLHYLAAIAAGLLVGIAASTHVAVREKRGQRDFRQLAAS